MIFWQCSDYFWIPFPSEKAPMRCTWKGIPECTRHNSVQTKKQLFRVLCGRSETSLISEDHSPAVTSAWSNSKHFSSLFRQINLSKYKAIPAQKCRQGLGSVVFWVFVGLGPLRYLAEKSALLNVWGSECPEWVPGIFNKDRLQGANCASSHARISSLFAFSHSMLFFTCSIDWLLGDSPAPALGYFSKKFSIWKRERKIIDMKQIKLILGKWLFYRDLVKDSFGRERCLRSG